VARATDVLGRPMRDLPSWSANPFGDGRAAERIADVLAGAR
jgi:hypothetical protein